MSEPLITIAVPSFNQGKFLDDALTSIFQQKIPVEVFVMDGGSSDNSIDIIHKWEKQLAGWRSCADEGQAAAINEGIARGKAPYVCWLNSDDYFLPDGLMKLVDELKQYPSAPAIYGKSWNMIDSSGKCYPVWVEPFNERRLALRCIISQPATLIRRLAWDAIGGLDSTLHMSMDYDLWWRLYKLAGALHFLDNHIAVNRDHKDSKTNSYRRKHYQESISLVRKYYGTPPLKWWLFWPYAVWAKSLIHRVTNS